MRLVPGHNPEIHCDKTQFAGQGANDVHGLTQIDFEAHSSPGTMKESNASNDEAIPLLVKLYLRLDKAIPTVHFPATKLDIGATTFWIIFFFIVRCIVVVPLFLISGWPRDSMSTFDATGSCIAGYFHSPQVVALSFALITTQKPYNPSDVIKDTPGWWRDASDAALQLCTGYMVYDSVFLAWTYHVPGQGIVLDAEASLFIAHHLATIFYMTTSRVYGAGQCSALTCIFLGEITNPAYSTYRIYGIAKKVGLTFSPFYAQFVMPVEVFTAALFLLLRVVLGPAISSYVTYKLMVDKSIRACTPLALRLVWVMLIYAVIFGSIKQNIIFYNLLKGYMRYEITNQEL